MQMCYSSYCQRKSFSLPRLRLPFPFPLSFIHLVTTHHIFAGRSLPMASVSTWCVKFWAGQSSVVCHAEVVPLLGIRSPWVPPERARLCGRSHTLWAPRCWEIPLAPFSAWLAVEFAAWGSQNLAWMRNPFLNNATKGCKAIQEVEKCLQLFSHLLLIKSCQKKHGE